MNLLTPAASDILSFYLEVGQKLRRKSGDSHLDIWGLSINQWVCFSIPASFSLYVSVLGQDPEPQVAPDSWDICEWCVMEWMNKACRVKIL